MGGAGSGNGSVGGGKEVSRREERDREVEA